MVNACPRSYLYLARKVVAAQSNPIVQETENNTGRAKGISSIIMSIFMSMSAANCSGPLLDSPNEVTPASQRQPGGSWLDITMGQEHLGNPQALPHYSE